MNRIEEIDLNITNKCNISCSHCLFSAGPDRQDNLPLSLIDEVLVDGKKLGAKEVHISGGEPLIRKDILAILKIAHKLGYFVRVQTNLWAFRSEMIPQLKKYTREILTSVDGLENSHDSIRRKGSFQKTIRWIKKLIQEDFRVIVITAVQKKNYNDIVKVVDLLVKIGVNAHFLFTITPLGRAKKSDIVISEKWEQLIFNLQEKYKSIPTKTDIVCKLHNLRADAKINFIGSDCRLDTKNHVTVLPNGEIFPCCLFTSTDKSLGNIKQKSLIEIWTSSPVWDFYAIKNDDPECKNCKLLGLCKGGCRGYSYLFAGSMKKKDPRCEKDRYPVCPSWKLNIKNLNLACATWKVMKR